LGEERDTLLGAREARHTPDLLPRKLTILLPTLTYYAPEFLKAGLKVVVAEERALDGPEDLAHGTAVQSGFYTH
jgi:hypothetical protein